MNVHARLHIMTLVLEHISLTEWSAVSAPSTAALFKNIIKCPSSVSLLTSLQQQLDSA
jgi:hypothetical protein